MQIRDTQNASCTQVRCFRTLHQCDAIAYCMTSWPTLRRLGSGKNKPLSSKYLFVGFSIALPNALTNLMHLRHWYLFGEQSWCQDESCTSWLCKLLTKLHFLDPDFIVFNGTKADHQRVLLIATHSQLNEYYCSLKRRFWADSYLSFLAVHCGMYMPSYALSPHL